MDGQHRYEIVLKQGDLFINLSSDDVYFISKQMDKWCQILMDDSYVPVALPGSKPASVPVPPMPPAQEPVPMQQMVYAQPPQQMYTAPPQGYAPQPYPQMGYPQPYPMPYGQPMPAEAYPPGYGLQPTYIPMPQQQQPVSPHPAPTIELPPPMQASMPPAPAVVAPIAQPAPEPVVESAPIPVAAPAPVANAPEEFEDVMDSLMKEFDDEPVVAPAPVPSAVATAPAFARVGLPSLESIANHVPLDLSSDLTGVSTLIELCDRADADSSEDYLLLSSYFLTNFEQEGKFSLKRINSMLVKSGLTPVNHSVLETTLGQGYLSMVPDLTGMAEVSEYVLTSDGIAATKRLFK